MQLINAEVVLETERLLLEPLQKKHAIVLFPLFQAKQIYQYIPQEPPTSVKALEQIYQRLEKRLSPNGREAWLNWAVYYKEQQAYIGRIEATVSADRSCQIAYLFSPLFWGHGYATEACQHIIANLQQNYHLIKILAEVDTRNLASRKLLQGLGFIQIETRRHADSFKGSYSDECVYQLNNF